MYEKIDYNAFYRLIGDNIKRIRMEHNDSQEAFAEKIDMSRGFLSQVESPGLEGIGVCRFVKHKLQSNDKPTIDYFDLSK